MRACEKLRRTQVATHLCQTTEVHPSGCRSDAVALLHLVHAAESCQATSKTQRLPIHSHHYHSILEDFDE